MLRTLFRAGNSLVVSLPKEALDLLGVREGAQVSVELDRKRGRVIIGVPGDTSVKGVDEGFARQVSDFIERYRPALQALAR